nr:immunoglobulin heavy chain junction region [Macaca mulatta]MOW77939.1 immunoglobulin heavy chain junction region [Macaca mulatta]
CATDAYGSGIDFW